MSITYKVLDFTGSISLEKDGQEIAMFSVPSTLINEINAFNERYKEMGISLQFCENGEVLK